MLMNLEQPTVKDNPMILSAKQKERLAIDKNNLSAHIKQGKNLPPGQLISCSMIITPELAQFILETYNKRNRPITENRVRRYADAMKQGRFSFTSQGISFNRDGEMNNGQHRLLAIVQSKQSVRLYLTFGEDVDAFEVLDTAGTRTGSDALSILGRKNTIPLSATVRMIYAIENESFYRPATLRNDEIIELMHRYDGTDPEVNALDEPVTIGHRLGAVFKTSGSVIAAALYLIQQGSKHGHLFSDFVQAFEKGTGLHSERDPILKLRESLHNKKVLDNVRSSTTRGVIVVACIIKAWNLFVKGKGIGRLTWSPPEKFPGVI